jgi:hypothetical protein
MRSRRKPRRDGPARHVTDDASGGIDATDRVDAVLEEQRGNAAEVVVGMNNGVRLECRAGCGRPAGRTGIRA